ncbi:Holliday junction endonuclease RuvC [Arboricoccus pini]|uniref:Crossover junction endodeoxyribonuclease RuvC n=1 Tax=Arboricoccus pini TaxID=1963835 RepID=A0A212QT77_9PROT|nr:crossover junction endodeoxyribonuclease RuvC [Arboricoccus pini]SNB62737.1 Holliday junction endonuclease RuvC [Arboricoccus pini]
MRATRLLGLDPGLRHTGWGMIESNANHLRFLACGSVDSDDKGDLASRLLSIHTQLAKIIEDWSPDEAAVEETVVNVNALSSLKLGHARGVIVLTAATAGLPVSEYASKRVKRALVGTGAATKEQVAMMVTRLLPGARAVTHDAMDALAIAICHAHERSTVHMLRDGRIMAGGRP